METINTHPDSSASPTTAFVASSLSVHFRRNYLLGLWAANELRMDDADADLYAEELARFGESASDDDSIVNIVRADIAAYNGDIGASIIWKRLRQCEQRAEREIPGTPETGLA